MWTFIEAACMVASPGVMDGTAGLLRLIVATERVSVSLKTNSTQTDVLCIHQSQRISRCCRLLNSSHWNISVFMSHNCFRHT